MKLRINKFTLSCVAVLSSAILFGVNGMNVQAADGGTGSDSSVSQSKDDYVAGEVSDGDWVPITWHIYNSDEDSYRLELGNKNQSVVENASKTTGNGNFDWMQYSSKITSAKIVADIKTADVQESIFEGLANVTNISGFNYLQTKDTTDFSKMFKDDSKLTTVDLTGLDTSSVQNFSSMFQNDNNLDSIDLSKIDMSSANNTSDMLYGTNLSSITLGKNSVLTNSGLQTDPYTYEKDGHEYVASGWRDSSDKTKELSTSQLIEEYKAGNDNRTKTTWVPNDPKEVVTYRIQYVDSNTGEVLPVNSDITAKGTVGQTVNLAQATNNKYTLSQVGTFLPGYAAYSLVNTEGTIEDGGAAGYIVKAKVQKKDPVNITVNETVGNESPIDKSFSIPVNDSNYKYENISEPSDGIIDLNKSTIKVGNETPISFKDYPNGNDLNVIVSSEIKNQLGIKDKFSDDDGGESPLITVNAVYTKKSTGGGSSSGNHHNNGNNNNNEDKGGTTNSVSQTVSTTTKDVSLYDNKGKLITDRALGKDSGWFSDQEYTLDGTLYYRVASDEYVKASDVYVYTAQNNIVRVQGKSIVYMVDSVGHKITDRALSPDTEWFSDRYTMISGQKYYRVATNEFVSAADVSLL